MVWLFASISLFCCYLVSALMINIDSCEKMLNKKTYRLKGISKYIIRRQRKKMHLDEEKVRHIKLEEVNFGYADYIKDTAYSYSVGKISFWIQIFNYLFFAIITILLFFNEFSYLFNARTLFLAMPYFIITIVTTIVVAVIYPIISGTHFEKLRISIRDIKIKNDLDDVNLNL